MVTIPDLPCLVPGCKNVHIKDMWWCGEHLIFAIENYYCPPAEALIGYGLWIQWWIPVRVGLQLAKWEECLSEA